MLVPLLLASIYLYMVSLLREKTLCIYFGPPIAGKYLFVYGLLIAGEKTFVYILVPLLLASIVYDLLMYICDIFGYLK